MKTLFKNKRVLVTGGTGTIGSALVKKILRFTPKIIRVFDNDENALYNLANELKQDELRLRYLLGDVRDKDRLNLAMEDIDVVYHAAALKHVPLCEYNPFEAVETNIIGTQNAIEAARANCVKKFVFISTDKSVKPVNIMGATKLLGERLTVDASYYRGLKKIEFSCVRFGNVLNSRGSVIPLWISEMVERKTLTVTDRKMTRFVISIDEAINLVLKSTKLMKGGEIFILKDMKAVRIIDLMMVFKDLYSETLGLNSNNVEIKEIGKRPGEKLDELLMTEDEAGNSLETKNFFIILPYNHIGAKRSPSDYKNAQYTNRKCFSSKKEPKLTKAEIRQFLKKKIIRLENWAVE